MGVIVIVMQCSTHIKNRYVIFRNHGYTSKEALHSAKVEYVFARLQILGFVCFKVEADIWADELNKGKHLRLRYLKEGCYGIITKVFDNKDAMWRIAESIWQFIGRDWEYSGYDTDIKRAAIDMLFNTDI